MLVRIFEEIVEFEGDDDDDLDPKVTLVIMNDVIGKHYFIGGNIINKLLEMCCLYNRAIV